MVTIKILGSGCANCKELEKNAKKAVKMLSIEAEVIKVTDHKEFSAYGILATPGLVINEKLVSGGRVLEEAEIVTFLANALENA